jgi:acyl-CoA synthetase (NDP forming)
VSVAAARFLAAAYDDVESAYVWYEHQHAGLGAEFVRAVEAAIAAAFAFPDAHPIVHRDARRILVHGFRTASSTGSIATAPS